MVQRSESERKAIVLRTSAEMAENFLLQLELLGEEYPRYGSNVAATRTFFKQLIQDAEEVGFLPRKRAR